MNNIFSLEYKKRTISALTETIELLNEELGFSERLRKSHLIEEYKLHILRLNKILQIPVGSQFTTVLNSNGNFEIIKN